MDSLKGGLGGKDDRSRAAARRMTEKQ